MHSLCPPSEPREQSILNDLITFIVLVGLCKPRYMIPHPKLHLHLIETLYWVFCFQGLYFMFSLKVTDHFLQPCNVSGNIIVL
jgi:hypothetical protein